MAVLLRWITGIEPAKPVRNPRGTTIRLTTAQPIDRTRRHGRFDITKGERFLDLGNLILTSGNPANWNGEIPPSETGGWHAGGTQVL